jgi:hypothetical protein
MDLPKQTRLTGAVFCMGLALLCLWGCGNTSTSAPESITGLNRLATEERFVASFQSVEFNPAGIVNLTYGTAQKVTVTVNENLMEYITTTVSGGELTIGVAPGVQIKNLNLTVDLVMTDLDRLVLNGAGNFIGKNLFQVDSATLNLNGAGGISLQIAADELRSILTGAGVITLNGNVTIHSVEIPGAGSLLAYGLTTETTVVTLSGSGKAEVLATQMLSVSITGAGNIYYKGNPTISKDITGAGALIDDN